MEKRINMSQDDLEKDVNSLQSKVNEATKGLSVNVTSPPSNDIHVEMVKDENSIQALGGVTLKRFFILLGGILVGIIVIFAVWRPNLVLHHNSDDEEIDEDGNPVKKPINLKKLLIISIIITIVIISVYVGYSRWKLS